MGVIDQRTIFSAVRIKCLDFYGSYKNQKEIFSRYVEFVSFGNFAVFRITLHMNVIQIEKF
jgi:hypothetical protein